MLEISPLIDWISKYSIEIFAAISGILFLYLEIKENILLWPVGIITSALYIYVFFQSKFYADMGLQVYYLIISAYGWLLWLRGKETNKSENLPIVRANRRQILWLTTITVIIFVAIKWILVIFTDSPVPTGDALTTALAIVATWMLAHKIIEQWWVWVLANSLSLLLYLYKGLYPTSVLFIFYTVGAIIGYFQWRKNLKQQT